MKTTYRRTAAGDRVWFVSVFVVILALGGCASRAPTAGISKKPDQVAVFSTAQLGEPHPLEWQPWIFSRFARRTDYRVVEEEGGRFLRAHSQSAASGLLQEVNIDSREARYIKWQWKVPQLLKGADLNRKGSDDSPARVIVSFDGNLDKLDVEERAMAGVVKLVSGREMPYATLMYVWDNKMPVGTFLENPHSSRAKLVVVASGPAELGKWVPFSRNLVADFRRAFGEAPGKITTVGVMTDSNATENDAIAFYGDIVISNLP